MMQSSDTNTPGIEMPKYKCHKEVWALKIADILMDEATQDGAPQGATITPTDNGFAPFAVDAPYMAKHKPVIGGYYILYKDGYKSFSPAEAFEEGYSQI